jgi:hypothetical protein
LTTKIVAEGFLELTFDAAWSLTKLDGEPFYRNKMSRLPGSKAVDVVGTRGQRKTGVILLLEAKDFRGHNIENKARFNGDDDGLAHEVASKVRDSLACFVGARRTTSDGEWTVMLQRLEPSEKCVVVLWLEQDKTLQTAKTSWVTLASTLEEQIKKRLSWLQPRVIVACTTTNPVADLGVSVASLRGAHIPSAPGVPRRH